MALLEGLEISEILRSDLEFSFRIDSEYYRKHLLSFENILRKHNYSSFSDVANFLIGPFGSAFNTENYVEAGEYRYVRGQDVKPFVLKDGENRYLPREDFERLKKYALKEKDILISVVGTLGNACIVQKKDIPGIFSCKSTVVRTKNINPVFALTYLNCSFGKELLLRKERGAIQKGLNLDDLKSMIIPVFSVGFQLTIEKVFYTAQGKIDENKFLYNQAETILLETLGLKDFEINSEAVNVKGFKESFLSTGRLDAEYYQKKYEEIQDRIQSFVNGYSFVLNEFELSKDVIDRKELIYNYTEISDVNTNDGTLVSNEINVEDLPDNGKMVLKEGHLIISKVRPYRGAVAIVKDNIPNHVGSGAFTILSEKGTYKKEVLQALLRSKPYQELIMKYNVGSSYPVVKDEDILNLPIPLLDTDTQLQISELIQESFRLKKESQQLLDLAKHAVEVAIEEGEEKAMQLIEGVRG